MTVTARCQLASNGVKVWIIGTPATTKPRWLRAIAFFAQNGWADVLTTLASEALRIRLS
jgi:hypothetical protein